VSCSQSVIRVNSTHRVTERSSTLAYNFHTRAAVPERRRRRPDAPWYPGANGPLKSGRSPLSPTAVGSLTSATDALGGVTRFDIDASGLLVSTTDADGVAQQLSRMATATSIEVRVKTAMGQISTYRTEQVAGGVRRAFIGADGATTTETAASNGSLSVALSNGTTYRIGAAPSAIWGPAAPVLTPNVETKPDGTTSQTHRTGPAHRASQRRAAGSN
jgi:YD repeat-containing protein